MLEPACISSPESSIKDTGHCSIFPSPNFRILHNSNTHLFHIFLTTLMYPTMVPKKSAFVPLAPVSAVNSFLDLMEDAVLHLSGDNHRAKNSPYVKGDFAPQHKGIGLHRNLCVTGSLPPDVKGAYMRVGPNTHTLPIRHQHHMIDGDGAVALFYITDDGVSLSWDWVETEKLLAERKGTSQLPVGAIQGVKGLLYLTMHLIREQLGFMWFDKSPANTSLMFHAGRIFALCEVGMPYELRISKHGSMRTAGRSHFYSEYDGPMSAHPKQHPNGNAYFVSSSFEPQYPACSVHVIGSDGKLIRHFPVKVPRPSMMHDTALTQNYVVIMDMPLKFDVTNMLTNSSLPFVFKKGEKSRFGLLPVDAEDDSDIQWVELDDGVHVFHTSGAYEDGEEVIIWGSAIRELNPSLLASDDVKDTVWSRFRINPGKGTVTHEEFPLRSLRGADGNELTLFDFPTIHPDGTTKAVRYAYIVGYEKNYLSPITGSAVGVVKFDMKECREVGFIQFDTDSQGSKVHGGECVFVPKEHAVDEDDGYLMTMTTTYPEETSALCIYDAKTMAEDTVAKVHTPMRLPVGLHSLHVPLHELNTE